MDETNKISSSEIKSETDKDDIIYKLISEKKAIKKRNIRLAALLSLVTKKISNIENSKSNKNIIEEKSNIKQTNDSQFLGIIENISSLKKQVSLMNHLIEKSKLDSKLENIDTTISNINSHIETIENKFSAINRMEDIENKLDDVESLIHLHKKTSDNPFGMLGKIKGDSENSNKSVAKEIKSKEIKYVSSSDFKDLDLKINKLSKKMDSVLNEKINKGYKDKKESKSKPEKESSHVAESMGHLVKKLYKH